MDFRIKEKLLNSSGKEWFSSFYSLFVDTKNHRGEIAALLGRLEDPEGNLTNPYYQSIVRRGRYNLAPFDSRINSIEIKYPLYKESHFFFSFNIHFDLTFFDIKAISGQKAEISGYEDRPGDFSYLFTIFPNLDQSISKISGFLRENSDSSTLSCLQFYLYENSDQKETLD